MLPAYADVAVVWLDDEDEERAISLSIAVASAFRRAFSAFEILPGPRRRGDDRYVHTLLRDWQLPQTGLTPSQRSLRPVHAPKLNLIFANANRESSPRQKSHAISVFLVCVLRGSVLLGRF